MWLQGARLHGWPAAELCQCHHRPWDDGTPKLSPLPRVCVVLLWMCCAAACSLPHCVMAGERGREGGREGGERRLGRECGKRDILMTEYAAHVLK